jgi:FkbM family methyltransferase
MKPPSAKKEPVPWSAAGLPPLPPASRKRLLGPALNAARRLLWRALGLSEMLQQCSKEILSLHAQLQALRQGQPFSFRPATTDEEIFQAVVAVNEYRLPEQFGPDEVVLDVGAHIGSCCLAALLRGAGKVYGFEPQPGNYALACRNLAAFGDRCRLSDRAVWRSDRPDDVLGLCASVIDPGNTGGGNVLWPDGSARVRTVSLDEILSEVSEGGRRKVRFLKIDCEGAEFPILLTSRLLQCVDQIHGEFHETNDGVYNRAAIPEHARVPGVDRFSVGVLAAHLRRAGFTFEHVREGDTNLGWFFAARRGP